jgi:ABC-type multidrug transport system ATPase subunit/CRP-like cAMP-binding protein
MDPGKTHRIKTYTPSPSAPPASPYEKQIRFLQRAAAFRQLPRDLLEHMAAALRPRTYEAGELICREGDRADDLCIIETGTVIIFAAVGQHQHELARLGPGETFGEVALLGDRVRTATVQAATPVRISTLSVDDFKALMSQSPHLSATMAEVARVRDRAAPDPDGTPDLSALLAQKSEVRLGRAADNELVLNTPAVSRYHAEIRVKEDIFQLYDTSVNGTFVNGSPVRGSVQLHDGDEIVIGDDRFVFDRGGTVHVVEADGIRVDAIHLTREVKDGKVLLHDISLSILAGDFVAIVGGSGAGKTTLMDALAGIRPATEGQVLYNGRDYYTSIEQHRQALGYVPQDDIIHHELTLRRTFRYAARLRLPRDTPKAAIGQAVDHAFDELSLVERAEVRVGALSGGQRKRASMGIELLTEPRIFFLDEPTSGLDPATEGQIMRSLRAIADGGRTVILTTHATKNVMLCDKIVILARDGYLAFVGPPAEALRYFGVESFDDIYELLTEQATPEEWGERFRSSPEYGDVLAEQQSPTPSADGEGRSKRGPRRGLRHHLHEWWVLSRRNFDLYTRYPSNLGPVLGQPVIFSVLLLALFESGLFEPDFPNPTAPLQLVFLLAFNSFLLGLLTSVQEVIKELPIFFRERNVGVGVNTYLLSKATFLVPVIVIGNVIMLLVLWVSNRLPEGGFEMFGPLFVSLFLVGTAGMALGLLTSSFVRTSQQGTDLLSLWIMPQVLFAGALFAVSSMNTAGRLISNLATVRWGFEATGNAVDLTTVFRESQTVTGRSLLDQYATAFDGSPVEQWMIMAAFTIIPLLLASIVLRTRQPQR